MKTRVTRWYNALLASVFALLGFEACNSEGGGGYAEYGTPTISFQERGQVTTEDGKPVAGIQVVTQFVAKGHALPLDSAFTDAQGRFESKKLAAFSEGELRERLVTVFKDVDGEANDGTFEDDTLKGSQMAIRQTGNGKGWYNGHYDVTADKQLKLKKK